MSVQLPSSLTLVWQVLCIKCGSINCLHKPRISHIHALSRQAQFIPSMSESGLVWAIYGLSTKSVDPRFVWAIHGLSLKAWIHGLCGQSMDYPLKAWIHGLWGQSMDYHQKRGSTVCGGNPWIITKSVDCVGQSMDCPNPYLLIKNSQLF